MRSSRLLQQLSFKTVVSVVMLGCLSILPQALLAQEGENAVYNSSGNTTPSPDFIDASVYGGSAFNICGVLHGILASLSSAAVIDARGLPGNTGTSLTCNSTNPSPWYGIVSPPASIILLPANTIYIPSTWIIPSNTRLIGAGDGVPLSGSVGTTIEVASSSSFSGPMLQFGSSSICPGTPAVCSGISVEDLTLDGDGGTSAGGPLLRSL